MLTLLYGENSFELERELQARLKNKKYVQVDGAGLTVDRLMELIHGQSLFDQTELTIIKEASSNSSLWQQLPDLFSRRSSDTNIIFVEDKPDKRTATFKWFRQHAELHEFTMWGTRDFGFAVEWVRNRAKRQGFSLTHALARLLVQRVGMNQWLLERALEKLALVEDLTEEKLKQVIDERSDENVFTLLTAALSGDIPEVERMLGELERTEDAYRIFGLLSSQIVQLTALKLASSEQDADVSRDLGVSPYVLRQFTPYAERLSETQISEILQVCAEADTRLKTTGADPWLTISHMLSVVARV